MATKKLSDLRVAIVHDWFVGWGAEQVVYQLHQIFPEAPIYTSYCNDEWRRKLDGKVVTGYLQRWPFSKLYKYLPVLRTRWFSRLSLQGYDLVISSSGNGEANAVRTPKDTTHICYCHSPTHFYWRHYDDYLKQPGFGVFDPLARLGLRMLVGPLRRLDYQAAQQVDYFIANSSHIQHDIRQYYGRESTVINPPVDIARFTPKGKEPRKGFVTIGRQKPYKRTDIIVEACSHLNLPLTVIGNGPDHGRLAKMAGASVKFITNASDQTVAKHLASAQAFLFAAHEDFGITPVEAMAAGTPVIAYQAGGALDYVKEGVSGLFFDQQTSQSLEATLQSFDSKQFNAAKIQKHAEQFSTERFRQHVTDFITGLTVSK